MLRLGLALLTAIVVAAAAGLVFVVLDLRGEEPLVPWRRLWQWRALPLRKHWSDAISAVSRHGVEEILAVAAVILCGTSAAMLTATGSAGSKRMSR